MYKRHIFGKIKNYHVHDSECKTKLMYTDNYFNCTTLCAI